MSTWWHRFGVRLPRHAELWLPGYLRSLIDARRERKQRRGPLEILFAICDHFEPLNGGVSAAVGQQRVDAWRRRYPEMVEGLRDADGRPPRHTFFFPIEQYDPSYLEPLAELCELGLGEVEVHLHHDNDTSENLRGQLTSFKETLHNEHGLLSRDEHGVTRYGFIHGNWALDNSLPDGRWCGLNDEITVLRETGCYADFTMPAAPSPAQVRTVNRIYYAVDVPCKPRSHETGARAAVGRTPPGDALLMIQGPLAPTWRRAKGGVVPRLEAGDLHGGRAGTPTPERLLDWLDCGVCVEGRPEWVFVKLHTHGAPEANAEMLLGAQMAAFHRHLLADFNDGESSRVHYVTTREMVNIMRAAEEGHAGNPAGYRRYAFPSPMRASRAHFASQSALRS